MDVNNNRTSDEGAAQSGAKDTIDWRTQLTQRCPNYRQRIAYQIWENLKKHYGVSELAVQDLKKCAVIYEETIHTIAKSQRDYLDKLHWMAHKLIEIENNAAIGGQNAHGSESHNMLSQVNSKAENLLQPTQMQPSQPAMMQSSAMQSTSLSNLKQNQQSTVQQATQSVLDQQSRSVPSQPYAQQAPMLHQQQSSILQKPISPVQQYQQQQQQQQLIAEQKSVANQQNQLIGTEKIILDVYQQEQRLVDQQNNIKQLLNQKNDLQNIHQQQLESRSNIDAIQRKQLTGRQPVNSGSPSNQQPIRMLRQLKVPVQQQMLQNAPTLLPSQVQQSQSQSQPAQQRMISQGQSQSPSDLLHQMNQLQTEMQQSIQTSLLQQQMQPYQLQRATPEGSSNSKVQKGNEDGADWQEEVYQKIKSMKEMYSSELNYLYQKVAPRLQQQGSLPHRPQDELIKQLKMLKIKLGNVLLFFQLSKHDIQLSHKEALPQVEKCIGGLLRFNKSHKPTLSQLQGKLPQAPMQLQQPQSRNGQTNAQMLPTVQQRMLQNQQLTQNYQERQMQQQPFDRLELMQQEKEQAKLQQTAQLQAHKMSQIHDANDPKMRQQMGIKSGVLQQQSVGQRLGSHHPQLKPVISSSQALSEEVTRFRSSQIDQQNMLASLCKAEPPLQSANSPFVVPSPSTSWAPSPVPADSEKVSSTLASHSAAGDITHQQSAVTCPPAQSLAFGNPEISASPLLTEFTSLDVTQANVSAVVSSKSSIEQPMERLMKVVKNMSPKALNSSVCDISSVVSMIDRIAGSAPGDGSRTAVGEDLVATTKCHLQAKNYFTQDVPTRTKKLKRHITSNVVSSSSSVNDSFWQLNGSEASESESIATSCVKRPRVKVNHTLAEEIRNINRQLIDTVVEISDEGVDPSALAATEGGEGTAVKCSFTAVALSATLKSQDASAEMSLIQPLKLLVPANYPDCSLILLDKFPVEVSKECEDRSMKAQSRFSVSLQTLSQPMSLKDIAKTWDVCAHAVISEYAQQSGGGTFSSKYGSWENCLSAA